MRSLLYKWKQEAVLGALLLCGLSVNSVNNQTEFRDMPSEFELHLLAGSKDELLETIFEEEKSDRLLKFIKNKKLKA